MKAGALGALLFGLALAASAAARPGGGQSFRSGSSTRSSGSSYSGGSSWGSSGSSRSSSGSSWSWGSTGSSRSSSSGSSGSSYSSPAVDTRGAELELAKARCVQSCVGGSTPEELSKCFRDCENMKLAEPAPASSEPSAYVSEPTPASRYFLIPCLLIGLVSVGSLVRWLAKRKDEQLWASVNADIDRDLAFRAEQEAARTRYRTVAAALAALESQDEDFSWVLLQDFLYALYAETQRARGGGRLGRLAPYLSLEARAALAPYAADEVKAVVVGALETLEVGVDQAECQVRVKIAFDANYTEVEGGKEQSFYVREVWTIQRGAHIKSRPPERARVVDCASCGAPLEKLVGSNCAYCSAPSSAGSRDWEVKSIQVVARELRGPLLTGTTEEEGTDLPTLVAPDAKQAWAALAARDPAFSWTDFVARAELVFHAFHAAWSARDLGGVRPYLSDALLETQTYWVEAYAAQKLRNVTAEASVVSVQLARASHDKHIDAITVRIFAQCKDYTLDESEAVVAGSRELMRRYSEYWTFIRSAKRAGKTTTAAACPSCGAPIDHIDVAGQCKSCHAKVNSGEFDWILSRIEQDEVYRA